MNNFLKHYKVQLEALSPIHIGSGEKVGKKEYIYIEPMHQVIMPDIQKLYEFVKRKGKRLSYESYLLENSFTDLERWLKKYGILRKDYSNFTRYTLDAGEAFYSTRRNGDNKTRDINLFIKDPYGLPYVPGSSLKGMLRSALMVYEIKKNPSRYDKLRKQIQSKEREESNRNKYLKKEKEKSNRNKYLKEETEELEVKTFHTLSRLNNASKNATKNAVNSNLSGLIIGDSSPIGLEQLTLSQKIDYSLSFKETPLPILRETLVPGTKILFDLTIDEQVCPYTIEQIIEAIEQFNQMNNKYFYSRFKRPSTEEHIVWLGGGVGFLSKTVIYALLDEEPYKVAHQVFKNTLGKCYAQHKHMKDLTYCLAPHVCKCTRYRGELYNMGMARITVVKS